MTFLVLRCFAVVFIGWCGSVLKLLNGCTRIGPITGMHIPRPGALQIVQCWLLRFASCLPVPLHRRWPVSMAFPCGVLFGLGAAGWWWWWSAEGRQGAWRAVGC